MEKRAKLAATMFGHNTRARRAQVLCVFLTVVLVQVLLCVFLTVVLVQVLLCVFLTVVLVQVLLCASDIETHPGPNEEMEQIMQRIFDQQEKRFETFFLQISLKRDSKHSATSC